MGVQVIQMFLPIVLGTTPTALYTMPTSPPAVVLGRGRVRFTNVTSSPQVVTAYDIPAGGSPATQNTNMAMVSIGPNAYLDVDMPQLAVGGSYSALAGASNAIVAHSMDAVLFS